MVKSFLLYHISLLIVVKIRLYKLQMSEVSGDCVIKIQKLKTARRSKVIFIFYFAVFLYCTELCL